jgi:hypothetical protein
MASSTETTATARFRAIVARALVFVLMVGPGIATWLAARRRYFNAEPLAGAAEASSQARPQCQGALATRYARPLRAPSAPARPPGGGKWAASTVCDKVSNFAQIVRRDSATMPYGEN